MSLSKITQIVRSSRPLIRLLQPTRIAVQNVVPKRNFTIVPIPYSMSDANVVRIALGSMLIICGIGTYIMFPYEGFENVHFSMHEQTEASLLASVLLSKVTPINAGPDGELNGFSMAQYEIEGVITKLNKKMQNCSDADEQKKLQDGKKLFEEMLDYVVSERKKFFPGLTCMTDVFVAVGKEAMKRDLSKDEVNQIVNSVAGGEEKLKKISQAYYNEKANEAALLMRPKLLKLREDPDAFAKLEKLLAGLPEADVKEMHEKVTLREPEGEMKQLLMRMLVMQKVEEVENPATIEDIRQNMKAFVQI